jgi:hypothetical protein
MDDPRAQAPFTIVTLEVDFMGNGRWQTYTELNVPNDGYVPHEFRKASRNTECD